MTNQTRMSDDSFFDRAVCELQADAVESDVWARAIGESEGDTERARALYIEYRIIQLSDAPPASAKRRYARGSMQTAFRLLIFGTLALLSISVTSLLPILALAFARDVKQVCGAIVVSLMFSAAAAWSVRKML